MNKFSFTVDIVTDNPSGVDVDAVRQTLLASVEGMGTLEAVHPAKVFTLAEQGYKVWAKRVAGVSLATPKPVKAPKAPKADEAPESEELVEA